MIVMLGTLPVVINMDVDFLVVDTPNNAYNAISNRMFLNKARENVLIPYLLMKFLTLSRISQVRVDQVVTKSCYMVSLKNLP